MGAEGIRAREKVLSTLREGDRAMNAAERVASKYKAGAEQMLAQAKQKG